MNSNRLLPFAMAIVCLSITAACGRPAPEERLIDLGEQVDDAAMTLEQLDEAIKRHEDRLDTLRTQRRQAKARLMTLEQRLERRATDLAIFRAAQGALLDEPALQESLVSVRVEDGVVTLVGSVANASGEQIAKDTVRAIPGVESIVSRVETDEPADVKAKKSGS